MLEVINKNKCTGCTACSTMCPKNAISMVRSSDGFLYPVIDNSKCIDCGLCRKKCPVLNTDTNDSLNECFVGYSKDDEILKHSSSGGIFTEIANYILENDGIVIGASFDQNKLKHIAVTKKSDIVKLQGSKYLQSDLNNIFSYVKKNIKDKKILFVGTPCQVAGLKAIIKNNDNLFCMDVICHGVPSPKLFEKYVAELEKVNNDELLNYDFRDKSTGWDTYSNTMVFKNKTISQRSNVNDYMNLFLSDVALRESCYDCNFKLGNKYSDITLGDFWGVKNCYPEMYNNKGVSAIVVNTENGLKLFHEISNNLYFKKCTIEDIVSGNGSLQMSSKRPKIRKNFFNQLDSLSISQLANKYCRKGFVKRIYVKTKRVIKNITNKF